MISDGPPHALDIPRVPAKKLVVTPRRQRAATTCKSKTFAVAPPQREHWSDNLACGANISCLRAQRAAVDVQGQRSTISGQRSEHDECSMVNVHSNILAFESCKYSPKPTVHFIMSVTLSRQLLCVIARPTCVCLNEVFVVGATPSDRRHRHNNANAVCFFAIALEPLLLTVF